MPGGTAGCCTVRPCPRRWFCRFDPRRPRACCVPRRFSRDCSWPVAQVVSIFSKAFNRSVQPGSTHSVQRWFNAGSTHPNTHPRRPLSWPESDRHGSEHRVGPARVQVIKIQSHSKSDELMWKRRWGNYFSEALRQIGEALSNLVELMLKKYII